MLASRFRWSQYLLSMSLLLGGASFADAQNVKGAPGQNCGCSKAKPSNTAGLVPNPLAVNSPIATAVNSQHKHHDPKHHHHSATPQTGLYPGQTTPWLMPTQPVGYPNRPGVGQPNFAFQQPIQPAVPGWGQPGYNMAQPNQPVIAQFQPAADPTGFGGPAYVPPQPNQPGNVPANPNQPGNVQLIPVVIIQTGYLVPVPNTTGTALYQSTQTSTPWMLSTGLMSNQPVSSAKNCACHKQNGSLPGQTVAMQNPSFGTQNTAFLPGTASQNQTQQRTTAAAHVPTHTTRTKKGPG